MQGDGARRMLAILGSCLRGVMPRCFGWRMEPVTASGAIPRWPYPGGDAGSPNLALGELLVRREGEEAASCKMALTLSASHTPSTAPTLGLAPGPAGTLPTADTAPKSSRERGHPGWVTGGGRRRWRGWCSGEGHSCPAPPTTQPPARGAQ